MTTQSFNCSERLSIPTLGLNALGDRKKIEHFNNSFLLLTRLSRSRIPGWCRPSVSPGRIEYIE